MPKPRVGIFPSADRQAIFDAAQRLRLDPYELGGFLSLESGPNMDPNIRGGAGGNYYGMIQFGPSERQKYLDPSKIGKYTRAEQMPKAVQFLLDRGFKPGQMGIDRAYATVLGGNPNVSLKAKDSFGTSVSGALPRFKKGGDLYENARRVLGDLPSGPAQVTPQPQTPASVAETPKDKGNQLGTSLLQRVMGILPSIMPQRQSSLLPAVTPELSGKSFLDTYRMFFDDELM
jgi:hypothetical protein